MWSRNSTNDWLDGKTDYERDTILNKARQLAPKMKAKYAERKTTLISAKKERLERKQKEKIEMKEKIAAKKAVAVNNLIQAGHKVWLTEQEVETGIVSINADKDKCQILLLQIAFYKDVMNVDCQRSLFNKTRISNEGKRVKLNYSELLENLKAIMIISKIRPEQAVKPTKLKPSQERGEIIDSHKKDLFDNLNDSRLKEIIKNQVKTLMPAFLENPESIVGRKVRYRVKEEDEKVHWSLAEIKKLIKPHKVPKKILFQIEFSDDDETYDLPVLSDFDKNDVLFI
eukprot:TCONS_00025985-protein